MIDSGSGSEKSSGADDRVIRFESLHEVRLPGCRAAYETTKHSSLPGLRCLPQRPCVSLLPLHDAWMVESWPNRC